MCQTKLRGLAKVDWAFTFGAAAYDLVRLLKLIGATPGPARTGSCPRLCRPPADHRDGRVGRNRPARIGHISSKDGGELVFIDMRYGARDSAACAEFPWEGFDDDSSASGRGWAALGTAGRLVGHLFIHNGDDSGFLAERKRLLQQNA